MDATHHLFHISTDPARLDVPLIHRYLSQESYWARHIPLTTVERSIAHSLNFGAYTPEGQQAGFARVISDRATFAYLCDVFVLPEHRHQGLASALVRAVLAHPELQGLRRHLLATLDAHAVYQPLGYASLAHPERWLERAHAAPYSSPST